jgi:hypothetical protein
MNINSNSEIVNAQNQQTADFLQSNAGTTEHQKSSFRHPLEELKEMMFLWASKGLKSSEILVLVSLWTTIDWSGGPLSIASVERLVAQTNLSKRSIQRFLKCLPAATDPQLSFDAMAQSRVLSSEEQKYAEICTREISFTRGKASQYYFTRLKKPFSRRPYAFAAPKPARVPKVLKESAQLGLAQAMPPSTAVPVEVFDDGPALSWGKKQVLVRVTSTTDQNTRTDTKKDVGVTPKAQNRSQMSPPLDKKTDFNRNLSTLSKPVRELGCQDGTRTPAPPTSTVGSSTPLVQTIKGSGDTLTPESRALVASAMKMVWAAMDGKHTEQFEKERLARGWKKCTACGALKPPHLTACPKCS